MRDPACQSNVVYRFECLHCNASYIGKTERLLGYRIKEHMKRDAGYQHERSNPGHKIDWENIQILDTADNSKKLAIKELLHILKREPSLNKQLNQQQKNNPRSGLNLKTLLIAAHPEHTLIQHKCIFSLYVLLSNYLQRHFHCI